MEGPVILLAHQEQLPILKHSNVSHVTVHAEHALTIQAHVLVVSQEKDIYKLQEIIKNVLNNALKEHSLKTMYVKYVILDVLNVLVLLIIVLPALLVDIFIMVLVGTIVQVLWLTIHVSINAQLDIGEFLINNVNLVVLNVRLVIQIQLV